MTTPAKPTAPRLLPDGGTVLILGSGPSLTVDDVRLARAHTALTIAVNDSYFYAPDADILFACDAKWWRLHGLCRGPHVYAGRTFPAFRGRLRVSLTAPGGTVHDRDVLVLQQAGQTGLSLDPTRLATGKNSVYQAMNLAVHLGATGIWLLGVDMQPGKIYRDGAWRQSDHFFGRHADDTKPPYTLCLQRFTTLVEPLQRLGIAVTNVTPGSALTCWPQRALADVCGVQREASA